MLLHFDFISCLQEIGNTTVAAKWHKSINFCRIFSLLHRKMVL